MREVLFFYVDYTKYIQLKLGFKLRLRLGFFFQTLKTVSFIKRKSFISRFRLIQNTHTENSKVSHYLILSRVRSKHRAPCVMAKHKQT